MTSPDFISDKLGGIPRTYTFSTQHTFPKHVGDIDPKGYKSVKCENFFKLTILKLKKEIREANF